MSATVCPQAGVEVSQGARRMQREAKQPRSAAMAAGKTSSKEARPRAVSRIVNRLEGGTEGGCGSAG
jgi:hypothetical protein